MHNLTTTSYGLSVHTPIDRVVMLIARRLELDDGYDYKLERWIRLLKDNWLQTAGALARVPEGLLEKLNLPVALKVELERISKLEFEQQSFFHVTTESTVDSRYQIKVSEKYKELVHHTFRQLLKFRDVNEVSGLQRFETEFFPLFFKLHPSGRRLFHEAKMDLQSKAFVRMLYWIIENMDSKDLSSVIVQLGGRHIIYNVDADEFGLMARAICDTLQQILGDKILNNESRAAWMEVLSQMAALMIAGGKQCEKGFQNTCKREKNNGTWEVCYVSLLLDTFYIYKDKTMKNLVGQFPLKGVLAIEFPKDVDMKNAFQVSSLDPPFNVKLASDTFEQLKEWLSEFDWRIQAVQRAFSAFDELDSVQTSESESYGSKDMKEIEVVKKQKKANKRIQKSKNEKEEVDKKSAAEELEALLKVGLELTAEEKLFLTESWTCLIEKKFNENGIVKSGIAMLFEEFFQVFFQENPSGRRLFEHSGLQVQGRALVSMIGMIIKSLEDFSAFSNLVVQLGGRHEIYGVNLSDYECFARVLSQTVGRLVGGENETSIVSSWNKCMLGLGNIMQISQQMALNEDKTISSYRKLSQTASWKQSALRLTLDSIYIFNGQDASKLRSSIKYKDFKDLTTLGSEVDSSFPYPHGFTIIYGEENEKAFFCFETEEEANTHFESISWRVEAQLRVFKYDDMEGETEDSSGRGGTSLSSNSKAGKSSKKQHFLSKKKEKKSRAERSK